MHFMRIDENVEIKELTTMRLGGLARYVIELETVEDVEKAYLFAKERQLPVFILGTGSNVIGKDEGFKGVILLNRIKGIRSIDELTVVAMGGELLDDLVAFTTEKNLSGIEALSAIPGTVGAAPVQNVGAYGQEIVQVLDSVLAYDLKEEKYVTIKAEDMKLGYRSSIFNHGEDAGRYLIISMTIHLSHDTLTPPFYTSLQNYVEEHQITDFSPKSIREMVTEIRWSKLPKPEEMASSGSFFKNVYLDDAEADRLRGMNVPVWEGNKVPSGWLIDHAGLKGMVFHGMRVSEKAALILINESAQSYAHLKQAREEIVSIIKKKYGLTLQQEPVELE